MAGVIEIYGADPAWSPSQLVNLAPSLQVALMRSMSLLWQDAAMTTLATANGDVVNVGQDPFTGAYWHIPFLRTAPALFDEGGGKWSLNFSGGSFNAMFAPFTYAWTPLQHACFSRVRSIANQAYGPVVETYDVNGFRVVTQVTAPPWGTYGGVDYPANTTLADGTVYTLGINGGTFRINGANDGTYANSSGAQFGTPNSILLGWDGFRFITGRISAAIVSTAPLSVGDQTQLEAYLGAL